MGGPGDGRRLSSCFLLIDLGATPCSAQESLLALDSKITPGIEPGSATCRGPALYILDYSFARPHQDPARSKHPSYLTLAQMPPPPGNVLGFPPTPVPFGDSTVNSLGWPLQGVHRTPISNDLWGENG